jgi:transcriptional regulator with XRE-family HTH domain
MYKQIQNKNIDISINLFLQCMKSEIDQFVVNKVLRMRREQNVSQRDLAFCINVNKSFIAACESPNSRAKYNISHLNEIAKVLNCKISDFLPEEPI